MQRAPRRGRKSQSYRQRSKDQNRKLLQSLRQRRHGWLWPTYLALYHYQHSGRRPPWSPAVASRGSGCVVSTNTYAKSTTDRRSLKFSKDIWGGVNSFGGLKVSSPAEVATVIRNPNPKFDAPTMIYYEATDGNTIKPSGDMIVRESISNVV